MTQLYSLTVKSGTWNRLSMEIVRQKMDALIALGHVVFDVNFDGTEPSKPIIVTETKRVNVLVCASCGYKTENPRSMNGHRGRVHPVKIPIKITK